MNDFGYWQFHSDSVSLSYLLLENSIAKARPFDALYIKDFTIFLSPFVYNFDNLLIMKKLFLTLSIIYGLILSIAGQTIYSKNIESQIKQVENNLAGRVIIDGKAGNILDRMALLKVKGLSIAVVNNYKVIWAKGYGWADEKEKRRVTKETLFEPGSISKTLNAVCVLKMV